MKILVSSKKQNNFVAPDNAKDYVKDKLGKVSNMLNDADRKFADAQDLYDKNSDTQQPPKSDYAEGASAAMSYARKQIDFIDDRIDDYLDDYNLKYL